MTSRTARTVHRELTRALKTSVKAEGSAVILFAEVMTGDLYRAFECASVQHYAEEMLGFSASKTAQFVRLARAIEELPALRNAIALGEVEWTKARELLSVAGPRTIDRWLELARTCSRRELVRRIAAAKEEAEPEPSPQAELPRAKGTEPQGVAPADPGPDAPKPNPPDPALRLADDAPMRIELRFRPEEFARFHAMLEAIRKSGGEGTREDLVLAALETQLGGSVAKATPYRIVTYLCKKCGGAHLPTVRGDKRLSRGDLAAQMSDAELVESGQRRRRTIPPAKRVRAIARDGNCCQAKGCKRTSFLEVHHRVPLSRGGTNNEDNLITLCSRCHRALHRREQLHPGATHYLVRERASVSSERRFIMRRATVDAYRTCSSGSSSRSTRRASTCGCWAHARPPTA